MVSDTYTQITLKSATYRTLADLKENDVRFSDCKTISAVIMKLIAMYGEDA